MFLQTVAGYVLPPTGFLVLGVAAVVLGRLRPRLSRALVGMALAGLLITALPVTARMLLGRLEAIGDEPSDEPAGAPELGAIVVLGGDQQSRAGPGIPFDVGPLSLERERAGAQLARLTGLPVLVTGGPLTIGGPPIAMMMARSLEADFAIQPRWVEAVARDTWQNAAFSADLLRRDGVGSAYVVTQGWHIPRALLAFRRAGFPVVARPTPPHRLAALSWSDLMPTAVRMARHVLCHS